MLLKTIPSLLDFFDWVRAQDPNEEYPLWNIYHCAMARYGRARGLDLRYTEDQLNAIGLDQHSVVFMPPYTFGALAERIERYMEARQLSRDIQKVIGEAQTHV